VPQQSPISFPMGTKNVLIIDGNEAMQKLRASVLRNPRSSGAHAESVTEAELLWAALIFSNLVLLDVRQRSKDSSGVLEADSRQHPGQRSVFLVGPPPRSCPPTCADQLVARDRVPERLGAGQDSCMSRKAYRPAAAR